MQMPSSHARATEVPQTAVTIMIIQITPALLNPTLIQLACEWQRRSIITLGEGTVTNKYSSSTKAPFIFTLYDPPVSDTNSRYIVDLCRLFSFLPPFGPVSWPYPSAIAAAKTRSVICQFFTRPRRSLASVNFTRSKTFVSASLTNNVPLRCSTVIPELFK